MKRLSSAIPLFLACWLLTACATGVMQLTSIPEGSSVQLISNRGDIRSLGKTPLNINMQRLFLGGADFANVRVEKEGFFAQSFIIPRTSMPTSHQISVSLEQKPVIKPPEPLPAPAPAPPPMPAPPPTPVAVELDKCSQLSKENLTRLSKGVAVVQSIIQKRDFEVAKIRLAGLIADFPYISVLYDLQGNIHYLQKSYSDAVIAYEKSLELDPENMETAFIVKKLRAQLGRTQ